MLIIFLSVIDRATCVEIKKNESVLTNKDSFVKSIKKLFSFWWKITSWRRLWGTFWGCHHKSIWVKLHCPFCPNFEETEEKKSNFHIICSYWNNLQNHAFLTAKYCKLAILSSLYNISTKPHLKIFST